MSKIYFYQALISFVTSLVGIFASVYLYSKGFSLVMILIYSLGISIMYILCAPFVVSIINKIGMKYTLLLSSPFYFIHLLSLQYITTHPIFFHTLWISQGIYVSLFWFTYRCEVINNGSRKSRGNEIGTLQIIATILTTIGPVIGGFFLEYLTYTKLLILATIFLIGSNIPLILSKDNKIKKIKFKHRDYLRLIKKTTNKKTKLTHICEAIDLTLSVFIWPIILFIFLNNNFASLGLMYTTLSILTVIVLIYLKTYIDKHSKKKVLSITSKLLSLGWLTRTIVILIGSIFLYIIESLTKLFANVLTMTLTSIFYNNTTPKTFIEALLTRVLYFHGTKVLFSLVLIIIFSFVENSFSNLALLLGVGIISSIGLNSISENEVY
jgi:MFS family permease